ncbi:MAG TPA: FHA domain-containing protein [Thermoanaerobaculia bacterium]|nr:FHA domain-containing protein [Thermoanaerobaculia bacterium]
MIIECTNCHSKYQYDEERFERKPSKKIRCAKCKEIFEIFNPAFAPAVVPQVPPGDETFTSRNEPTMAGRTKTPEESTESSPIPERSTDRVPAEALLPAGKRLSIAVIDGPDAGSVFRIEKPRITIGRSGADLVLNDSEASRNHAALEVRDTIYLLEDLRSTNGTLINGRNILEPVEIQDKSEFQVGASTLMLIVTDEQ